MMIAFNSVAQQDTIRGKNQALSDSVGQNHLLRTSNKKQVSDSTAKSLKQNYRSTVKNNLNSAFQSILPIDTTSVCQRNSIADISFYFPDNIVSSGKLDPLNRFPFEFTEKNRRSEDAKMEILLKQLKQGQDLPVRIMHDDWVVIILAITFFIFSLVRSTSKSLMPDVRRFFLFRSVSDPSKRKGSGLAQWQSLLLNLDSFFIISLFIYCFASFNQILPAGFSRILIWLILLAVIMLAAGTRYTLCKTTGKMSGTSDLFREYLFGVYQFYRLSALFLYLLIMLISYTLFFPSGAGFVAGTLILGTLYIVRIIRLFMIFLNSNISIFYLILYLCTLEILPVLIIVKYVSGLV